MPGTEPDDADAFRARWAECRQRWVATIESGRTLPDDALHERVNGEWSFVQTLRHLLFVTDSWVSRGVLEQRDPWHHLGIPPTGMTRVKGLDDPDLRADRAEVLELRAERVAIVDRVMKRLTDTELAEERRCVGAGHPKAGLWPVRRCLDAVVNEEWKHRDYAERDLAALRGSSAV